MWIDLCYSQSLWKVIHNLWKTRRVASGFSQIFFLICFYTLNPWRRELDYLNPLLSAIFA